MSGAEGSTPALADFGRNLTSQLLRRCDEHHQRFWIMFRLSDHIGGNERRFAAIAYDQTLSWPRKHVDRAIE